MLILYPLFLLGLVMVRGRTWGNLVTRSLLGDLIISRWWTILYNEFNQVWLQYIFVFWVTWFPLVCSLSTSLRKCSYCMNDFDLTCKVILAHLKFFCWNRDGVTGKAKRVYPRPPPPPYVDSVPPPSSHQLSNTRDEGNGVIKDFILRLFYAFKYKAHSSSYTTDCCPL